MQLHLEQLAVARACGCAFLPATEDQVRRLAMQRRIFSVGGLPFVAARDGFFETHGTLAALIENHRPAATEQGAGTGAEAAAERGAGGDAEPPPAPAEPEVARTEQNVGRSAPARRRKPKPPRPEPASATDGAAPTGETAAVPSVTEEMLAGVAAAQGGGPRARVLGRWRAGQPPTPRWMAAGKARRGRLK